MPTPSPPFVSFSFSLFPLLLLLLLILILLLLLLLIVLLLLLLLAPSPSPSPSFSFSFSFHYPLHSYLPSHISSITCLATNNTFDVIVSVCSNGTIGIHHLKDGKSVTTIKGHEGDSTLRFLTISEISGNFVIFSEAETTVFLYSINGTLIGKE
jgi:WD40 repeat protein